MSRRSHCQKETIGKQKVVNQCVKNQKVVNAKFENFDTDRIETDALYINNKLFPSSIIPFSIKESTTIVGTNNAITPPCDECTEGCPEATPGTPTGGLFALGKSFTGKITFCNVKSMQLNLTGLILNNNDDFALEFINCNQVYVYAGTVNSLNATAIRVSCCSNIAFSHMNTTLSNNCLFIEKSYDIHIKSWYLDNLSGYAFNVNCTNYLRLNNLDINNIFAESPLNDALIMVNNSEMVFISNCAYYNINYTNVSGTKSIMKMNNCFDVKISHVSILTTAYSSASNEDLNIYLVYLSNCGSLVLGSFIIDGDLVNKIGTGSAELNCLRLTNCNNTFMAHHLMTDNFINADGFAKSLTFHGIYLNEMTTFTMNSSKICTNFLKGAGVDTLQEVRSFYGEAGGNWYLSGNICNENRIEGPSYLNTSVAGFEVVNIRSSVILQKCSANNHGASLYNIQTSSGFIIRAINPDFNNKTSIDIDNCSANQNVSDNTFGTSFGYLCTYSNTLITNSEAISNEAGLSCYGFLLPGLIASTQNTVSLFNCSANTNFSALKTAYGVYSGKLDLGVGLTDGVATIAIKKCTFTANGPPTGSNPPNPGYGIYLNEINVSSIIGNLLNENNYALYINMGLNHSIISNSAVHNDVGFEINEAGNSIIQKNLSQNNFHGYIDNTTAASGNILNSYFTNNAVANTLTSYEGVSPSRVPWYMFSPATGNFSPAGPAINPTLNSFTNLSS